MRTIEYIAKLRQRGIYIELVNNQLKISGDSAKLTKQLLEELKSKKDEIINFLSKYTKESNYTEINYTEKKEYYSATSAQIRMYLMQQMNLFGVAYNLYGRFKKLFSISVLDTTLSPETEYTKTSNIVVVMLIITALKCEFNTLIILF